MQLPLVVLTVSKPGYHNFPVEAAEVLQQQAVDVPVLERGKGQAPRGAWPAPPEELLQLQWESDRIRQQATRPGVRMLGDGDAWGAGCFWC